LQCPEFALAVLFVSSERIEGWELGTLMIDRLMSRIRIQTKVLVLVAPFVLSITAVGLTGLYASGLLQGRIEISNDVLKSLSGFKQVFSSMSRFLMLPSEEARDAVRAQLAEQVAELEQMSAEMRGKTDVALLDQALAQSTSIENNIATLWALHQQEQQIMADVAGNTEALLAIQGEAGKRAFTLLAAAKTVEKSAKAQLNAARQLTELESALEALVSETSSASTTADEAEAARSRLPAVSEAIEASAKAFGREPVEALESLRKAVDAAKDISANAAADFSGSAGFTTALQRIVDAAKAVKALSGDTMRKAQAQLGASDDEISKADKVGNKLRAIVGNLNQIRVAFAELSARPDEAMAKQAQKVVYLYGKDLKDLTTLVPEDTELSALPDKAQAPLSVLDDKALAFVDVQIKRQAEFDAAAAQIDATWTLLADFAESQKQSAGEERQQANSISVGATVVGVLVALTAGLALVMTLKGPIGQITAAMRHLAEGALDTAISGDKRLDEIGDMARALAVFKGNALAKESMEREAEASRRAADAERQRNEAERQESVEQIQFAVDTLALALSRLSQGDLTVSIETSFAADLDRLRHDFNASVQGLRSTLIEIHGISGEIDMNGQRMTEAVGNLAQRTEQQAAAVEETVSTVDEVVATVRTTSKRADEVRHIVEQAKHEADNSSDVVRNAMSAMLRIREASDKIGQIVSVIDSIAFQTNLLALNAGVEAARAGEAGKGFAVVAQEVRELAQRAGQAAKEIGALIVNSTREVATGSQYVEQTGNTLTSIARQIVEIAGHVNEIATSTTEQSTSLDAVNGSINEIDQMTQRNAAMVEETNAATQQLADEIQTLANLVARFRLVEEQYSVPQARVA
jgi:methyl-accepting chemotaxis protein